MNRRLPFDYEIRPENAQFLDAPTAIVHQHQVYEFLHYLVRRGEIRRIIDIGCGSARKLQGLDPSVQIICLDSAPLRGFVLENVSTAQFIECDFETGLPNLDHLLQDALVVCSDVVEHLRQPEILMTELARISRHCRYLLISTPDRARARGLMDPGPPQNPAHTMEWTADEFGRFLRDCGFADQFFLGYTHNNNRDLAKNTILAIAGKEATFTRPLATKSVAAVINIYNEEDIIERVARHLREQGVEVHIIDNWSTDGTSAIVQRLVAEGICTRSIRYPDQPPADYDWADLLRHAAEYGAKLSAEWLIHYDADELRFAPWSKATLAEAITFVDSLGYSAIDFTVANFAFTETDTQQNSSIDHLRFFDFGRRPAHLLQVKAWKNHGQIADLASSGGHIVKFPDSRVYPLKFLTRHYPLRSKEQAMAKIFMDRLPRVEREKHKLGWHTHYDVYAQTRTIEPWRAYELRNFDPNAFAAEFLVERLSGVGIELETRATPNVNTMLAHIERAGQMHSQLQEKIESLVASASGNPARVQVFPFGSTGYSEDTSLDCHIEIGQWKTLTFDLKGIGNGRLRIDVADCPCIVELECISVTSRESNNFTWRVEDPSVLRSLSFVGLLALFPRGNRCLLLSYGDDPNLQLPLLACGNGTVRVEITLRLDRTFDTLCDAFCDEARAHHELRRQMAITEEEMAKLSTDAQKVHAIAENEIATLRAGLHKEQADRQQIELQLKQLDHALETDLIHLRNDLASERIKCAAMEQSRSWRLTKPLRVIMLLFRS